MNVDEAMEAAAEFKVEMKARPAWTLFSETVAVVLAAEVERLRAELTVEREAFKLLVGLRAEVLTKLAETKAEYVGLAESHDRLAAEVERLREALFEMQQAAIRLVGHIDEAKAELAAAKAASVLPVEIQSVYVNKYLGSVVVFIGNEKGAVEFDAWLCDRVKERGER